MARVRRLCHIKIADWNYMILQSVTSTIMLFMQTSTSIIEVAGNIPRCSDQSPARTATRKMHTIHDKQIVLDCGTAVATTSRIISGFGRSSLRRKPNTTSEELRAAVESTRPARNLEIYFLVPNTARPTSRGDEPPFYSYF